MSIWQLVNNFLIAIILLVQSGVLFAQNNSNGVNQCSTFDNIALQFALTQKGMQSPLDLEQLQQTLGPVKPESTTVITTYVWHNKKRILLVKSINDDLTTKLLTGSDDGSPTSKKMEQIYEKLKSATSVWFIKEIQSQLGPGLVTSNKLQSYRWHCGIGTLEIAADTNNNIITASIDYRTHRNGEIIESQLGFTHPVWDIKTDLAGEYYRAWKRSFE